MRSSTSSFSLRLFTFVGVLLLSACLIEVYCRYSPKFNDQRSQYLSLVSQADARNAVFGDSHVGQSSHIPGYAFLGTAGQQPEELLLLVHHLYRDRAPVKVIMEASPQWFGEYHIGRVPMITAASLAPPVKVFGIQIKALSAPYAGVIFDNLLADVLSVIAHPLRTAHAAPQESDPVRRAVKEWESLADSPTFDWSQFPADERALLTMHRVSDQNPIANFEQSAPAAAFEEAIQYIKDRGGKVCLFRTPVTADYIRMTHEIPDSRFDAFDTYARKLSVRDKMKFVDFRSLPFVFDDLKFANQDHLTWKAAEAVWPLVDHACWSEPS